MKSVSGVSWIKTILDEDYVSKIKNQFSISDLLARLVSSRTRNIIEAEKFLYPKLKTSLPDPMHLIDMDKAVAHTVLAIKENRKICVFGDYDVDGATSSALLKSFFRDINIDLEIYIPDRVNEGYGPTIQAMQRLKDKGVKLVITVDCGTSSFEPIEYAKHIGIDVIVLDHHISVEHVKHAIAVVNPNRIDEQTTYKYLAAVGVSFLFVIALSSHLSSDGYFDSITKPNLMNYLDLVALGTVCDVMPIIGLNRAMVAQGLNIIIKRNNIGLKVLCDHINLTSKINCYHLGFIIGPRINAGGRVGKSDLGAKLLSTSSENNARNYVTELEEYNDQRKLIESIALEEAIEIATKQLDNNILFIIGKDWHPGVIGIIASRIKDKFNKPVAVVTLNQAEAIGKASCRSISGVDIGSKIINAKESGLLVNGGGHAMAAGFTVHEKFLPKLQEYLNDALAYEVEIARSKITKYYELELTPNSINFELLTEINKLEPFGIGNNEPLTKLSNLIVIKANIVGEKHIQCIFKSTSNIKEWSNSTINAIAFNAVDTEIESILLAKTKKPMSVIGILKINAWQNTTKIQLQIIDILLISD